MSVNVQYKKETVTIPSGSAASPAIDVEGGRTFAIEFPATFDGATVTFEARADPGATSGPAIYDDAGSEYSVTATDGALVVLDDAALALASTRYISVVSSTNETADRDITLHIK